MFRQRNLRDLFGIGFTVWEYTTADSLAEVMEPGYFDAANPTRAYNGAERTELNLKPGDMIFARVAEGSQILVVDTADRDGVEVSQYKPLRIKSRKVADEASEE